MRRGAFGASRRSAVVLVAAALIAAMAPAAVAKPRKAPRHPLPRTGLIVSACKFSHRSNDDPIVYPGVPGAAHSHDFFGNVSTDANSTVDSLTGRATTCSVGGDTAAYWAPTVNVDGVPVRPGLMLAYYSVFGNDPVNPLPIGLKMLAKGADNVRFSCFRHGMPTRSLTRLPTCKPNELLSIGINFPSCWNGVDLDSVDHRSHMAYASFGVCPDGYPVKVPRLAVWVLYKAPPRGSLVTLSSGLIDSAHADYINSWDPQTLRTLEDFCLSGHRACYKTMPRVLNRLHLAHNRLAGIVTASPTSD